MEIQQLDEGKKGHFKAIENQNEAGRITYTWAGEDKLIIDHTEVDPAFSGKGIGKKMLEEVVSFARKRKIKIIPLCPFAKKIFDNTTAFQDTLF